MHLHVNLITLAENAEDAKSNVRCWIDDYSGKEFFDYGVLEEPETVVLVSEIRDQLEKDKEEAFKMCDYYEKRIQAGKIEKNKGMEGYYHLQLGRIMCEHTTEDMPFFNIVDWDWSIPNDETQDAVNPDGMDWYAVMVDLHC